MSADNVRSDHGIDPTTGNRSGREHRSRPRAATSSLDGRWGPKYGGLLIAAIGFGLTRFVLVSAVEGSTALRFLVSGGLALLFGLAVILVGVALTVSSLRRSAVNTIAAWCMVGVGGMALVSSLGVIEAMAYGESMGDVLTDTRTTNALIGGAVGGLLIGGYSVKTREYRRERSLTVDQMTLLNRIVRDKVLNKTNVIRANVEFVGSDDGRSVGADVITRSADELERAVAEVDFLTRTRAQSPHGRRPVSLDELLDRSLRKARDAFEGLRIERRTDATAPVTVPGGDQLGTAFDRLFSHLAEDPNGRATDVTISVLALERAVTVRVTSPDLSVSDAEEAFLVDGELPEHDDPSVGFDLPIVGLLVRQFGGQLGLVETGSVRGIEIALPRADGDPRETIGGVETGVDPRQFLVTALAALAGGVAMGMILSSLTDTLPAIGGLYGAQSLAVGWIIHLFHSVVFGIFFVAVLEGPLFDPGRGSLGYLGLGVAYGLLLWVVVAGFVMPVWLAAVGIEATIPNLSLPSLLGHVAWGAITSGLYGLGIAALRERRSHEPSP